MVYSELKASKVWLSRLAFETHFHFSSNSEYIYRLMNGNNVTYIEEGMFQNMPNLRTL